MPAPSKLGSRYVCFRCGCRFYDMNRPVPTCPECGADQREAPKRSVDELVRRGRRGKKKKKQELEPVELDDATDGAKGPAGDSARHEPDDEAVGEDEEDDDLD